MIAVTSGMAGEKLLLTGPVQAKRGETVEYRIFLQNELKVIDSLPVIQRFDAYDCDRNDQFVRLDIGFRRAGEDEPEWVPAFLMRPAKKSRAWEWRVRWSGRKRGRYTLSFRVTWKTGPGPVQRREGQLAYTLLVTGEDIANWGFLGCRFGPQSPCFVQSLAGKEKTVRLWGLSRAWINYYGDPNSPWGKEEYIDRQSELLEPMRKAGFNMLNYWHAPWEMLLIHQDRAEHWFEKGRGNDARIGIERVPLPSSEPWKSWMYYDQGRARAFDQFVTAIEADSQHPVWLHLVPLPHLLFRHVSHPWHNGYSGWAPEENPAQPKANMNGFHLYPGMKVWAFFRADPLAPFNSEEAKLFDAQANYFRYLIARWSASRAIGIWVLLDELDGIGEELGSYRHKTGFWAHPEGLRWLTYVYRLFRGNLRRSDGLVYSGDPWGHPIEVGMSSAVANGELDDNFAWIPGNFGDRPEILGWHWYPHIAPGSQRWEDIWLQTIRGIVRFAQAGERTYTLKLISEFGAIKRMLPTEKASPLYPSFFHFAAWAAIFSGLQGSPMEWNDGKEFGEFVFRLREGAFSPDRYPIDLGATLQPLINYTNPLRPDHFCATAQTNIGVGIRCSDDDDIALGLVRHDRKELHVWFYSSSLRPGSVTIYGLYPGRYQYCLYDPWTGKPIYAPRHIRIHGSIRFHPGTELIRRRSRLPRFPTATRLDQGYDLVIALRFSEE
ncbi:MAG: hypothetical protein D6820_15735 [Lentisphaerae bacterium]|nr:MAG: hypothetical protein D6820_15735 [Lentisphaerota bacterium]